MYRPIVNMKMEQNYSKTLLGTLKKFEKAGESNLVSGCREIMLGEKYNHATNEVLVWSGIILFILKAEGPSGLVLNMLVDIVGTIPSRFRIPALLTAIVHVTDATTDEERLRLLNTIFSFYMKCKYGSDFIGN